jgi:hypothetical protein
MDAFDHCLDFDEMDAGIVRIGGFSKMTNKYQLFAEGYPEPDPRDRLHERVKHVLEASYSEKHVSHAAKITGMIIAEAQDDSVVLDELDGAIEYLVGNVALLQAKIDEALRALELLKIRELSASGSCCVALCVCVCVCVFC